ncbi:MAG TPA: 4-alpha-glucanotransferase [Pseudonocardiaceae bacterium]|nr:4-alpha-glucanotransferase [Pseudonocardiaceae bacterium]
MDTALEQLAAAHGVATWYRDAKRRRVDVDPDVVRRVLGLLGVSADNPAQVRDELAAARAPKTPGTLVLRQGQRGDLPEPGVLTAEDGTERAVTEAIPPDLAPGWYSLTSGDQHSTVLVAPPALPEPPRTWGWMLQLYALHSKDSWGLGDLGDLREFLTWTATTHGAGAVLVNPLHAVTPIHPVQASPYSPSSRRFINPLYLRITDIPAYRRGDPTLRAAVDALRVEPVSERIDYDAVWQAKQAALELLWQAEGAPRPAMSEGLRDFATFCALAQRHGPRWSRWSAELRHPATASAGEQEVAFHAWVQQQCAAQLAATRHAARRMAIGVVHDLAVGVDPEGADAWALQDVLATGVTVGAPPDTFNQKGQDWGLPPWRPDRLAATGYAAYRDMLRAVLAHSDGLRIDHVAGLWRLWWVPPGASPDQGTYVHYDASAMVAALTLEAHRASAIVIGEDLGTVEPEVTKTLAAQRMLGSAVLWFARDEDAPGTPLLAAQRWPARAAASISTHDLPTALGFLRGEHVRARAELGLLNDEAAEWKQARAERAELVALLRAEGLLSGDSAEPSEEQIVVAMHALLARTPCRLLLASPYDVVGELRQPNLPGTVEQYPNWRLPLPVTLEQLQRDPRVNRVLKALRPAGDTIRSSMEP